VTASARNGFGQVVVGYEDVITVVGIGKHRHRHGERRQEGELRAESL
jgi:hypothetical protein